jgi:ankyrin repeat protein
MKKQALMTFERLVSRSFGDERSRFWRGSPRGLNLKDVQQYLDEGGDPNHRADSGHTLLHIAADNGEIEIMRLLVAHGADVNARGYRGYTPLHMAVDSDCDTSPRDGTRATELPLTMLILGAGADESARDDDGETARDIAVAYGGHEAQLYDQILRSPGA